MVVVLFFKYLLKRGDTHDEPHALLGEAREVVHQPVVLLVVRDQHGLANTAQNVGAVQEVLLVEATVSEKVVECDLEKHHSILFFNLIGLDELFVALFDHVHVHLGYRAKASAHGQNVPLVQ